MERVLSNGIGKKRVNGRHDVYKTNGTALLPLLCDVFFPKLNNLSFSDPSCGLRFPLIRFVPLREVRAQPIVSHRMLHLAPFGFGTTSGS